MCPLPPMRAYPRGKVPLDIGKPVGMMSAPLPMEEYLYYEFNVEVAKREAANDSLQVPAFPALRGPQRPGPFGAGRAHAGEGMPAGHEHLFHGAGVEVSTP